MVRTTALHGLRERKKERKKERQKERKKDAKKSRQKKKKEEEEEKTKVVSKLDFNVLSTAQGYHRTKEINKE